MSEGRRQIAETRETSQSKAGHKLVEVEFALDREGVGVDGGELPVILGWLVLAFAWLVVELTETNSTSLRELICINTTVEMELEPPSTVQIGAASLEAAWEEMIPLSRACWRRSRDR
ncbi:hypothetical protein L914_18248, partial [Phytophthora nicotianae]